MDTQQILFKEEMTGSVTAALLNKNVLKARIKSTSLNAASSLFTIEKWQAGDERLPMYFNIEKTRLGKLLIAATSKGITYLGFITGDSAATIADLKRRFKKSNLLEGTLNWHAMAINHVNNTGNGALLRLHLKGTEFQQSIWEKLILIPFGGLINYKQLSSSELNARAIGAAVGANPVGYLVPCHRVIHADGNYDGYFWGNDLKAHLLAYEASC